MSVKDPITCHVLDTTLGRPGKGIYVVLASCRPGSESVSFRALTDDDGRITSWGGSSDTDETLKDLVAFESSKNDGTSNWKLQFNTEDYYGKGKTFWPYVELTFTVTVGEHFHVPLLLGPYSYTTYRGS